jgi:hypothetical protein
MSALAQATWQHSLVAHRTVLVGRMRSVALRGERLGSTGACHPTIDIAVPLVTCVVLGTGHRQQCLSWCWNIDSELGASRCLPLCCVGSGGAASSMPTAGTAAHTQADVLARVLFTMTVCVSVAGAASAVPATLHRQLHHCGLRCGSLLQFTIGHEAL